MIDQDNKYYTPTPEEFHIGFKFEVYVDIINKWREFFIKDGKHLDFIITELKKGNVRVKKTNTTIRYDRMKKVYAVQDDASHWYLIPIEEMSNFRTLLELCEQGYKEAEKEFNDKFSSCMTGGDINNVQLYIESSDQ